jgi:hypothetical protein
VETLVGIIGLILIWVFFGLVVRVVTGTLRAGARTVIGKGSFTDNFRASVVGMGPLEARAIDEKLSKGPESIAIKEIQVKGLLPINRKCHLAFVTSLFDETSGEYEPIISSVDAFQEAHTLAYQHFNDIGVIEPGIGLISWSRVGAVIPPIIQTPYSGKRKLVAMLRLVDFDNRPNISAGFHQPDGKGILWQRSVSFEYLATTKGYVEAAEQRNKARLLTVRLAMAIAMWDGSLNDQEGQIIKKWVEKILSGLSGENRTNLKNDFNRVMKDAYKRGKDNDLSLTEVTESLNEVDDTTSKYEAVELCFDVLSCRPIDIQARVVDLVAKALKLDAKQIEQIRDAKIVGLSAELSKNIRIEDLLGIDERWTVDQIKRHLRSEFQKWNNRLTTLPEGEERNNAQRMLYAISEARKKYG